MAYTLPLLNLTETDSFTKFCTKYLSDSNQTREGNGSGSAAKTKRCRRAHASTHTHTIHARAPNSIAQFWICTACFNVFK